MNTHASSKQRQSATSADTFERIGGDELTAPFRSHYRRVVCAADEARLVTDCVVLDIIDAAIQAIHTGQDAELIANFLPSEFMKAKGPNYHDPRMLHLLKTAVIHRNPLPIKRLDGYRLAHLAIALLNYDAAHQGDGTPALLASPLRYHAVHLIKTVDSGLLDNLRHAHGGKLLAVHHDH